MARKVVKDDSDPQTKLALLKNVPPQSIVRVDGRWGVAIGTAAVDFWWEGREHVPSGTQVELLTGDWTKS